jgi:hypothetical protein
MKIELTEAEFLAVLPLLTEQVRAALPAGVFALPALAITTPDKPGVTLVTPPSPLQTPQVLNVEQNPYQEMDFSSSLVPPYIPPRVSYPEDKTGKGKQKFFEFCSAYAENFGIEDAEQPNRGDMTRDLGNHPKVYAVLGYIQNTGGLTHSVLAWAVETGRNKMFEKKAFEANVTAIAGAMCQVSSILFPELSDLFEHRDIFKEAV